MTEPRKMGRKLDLYISSPQVCDYIPTQESQSIFISTDIKVTPGIYQYLIGIGFRRSGQHTYRPHCSSCRACIACRVNTQQFRASRSQKRLLQKNKDLTFTRVEASFNDEHFDLYLRYQSFKHPGGSMENFGKKEYTSFLCDSFGNSVIYETRLKGKLLAVAVTDIFENALSAVYTYFDPDYAARSLGTYNILQQIQMVIDAGKQHLYLGYYIKDSLKMSYKANFRPIEMLINGEWLTYDKGSALASESSSLDAPLRF
ncbi:MAG: arginyltransferase [Piscirickettsiaceae bacterium]|nr:MAG: arginyltransferase [Piscirickettsiaceae bacterium]PCI69071.1 MAG: arginyltransferase [Piscirickettsiaceae bacterium]